MAMKNWPCGVTVAISTVPWFKRDIMLLHLLVPFFSTVLSIPSEEKSFS